MKDIQTALAWATAYCEEYSKKDFDPFPFLTGTESRQDKIYALCCNLLHNAELLNEQFSSELKRNL